MQAYAIEISKTALTTAKSENQVADSIKASFDQKYEKTWHCIVGIFEYRIKFWIKNRI